MAIATTGVLSRPSLPASPKRQDGVKAFIAREGRTRVIFVKTDIFMRRQIKITY